jgi:putative sigma-54 modulation protein
VRGNGSSFLSSAVSGVVNPFTMRPAELFKMELIAESSALVSEEVRRHAMLRTTVSLARFKRNIDRVTIRLSDSNGDRPGGFRDPDKRCRIEVRLTGGEVLIARGLAVEFGVAVDEAATRIKHVVRDHFGQRPEPRRERRRVAVG